MNSQSTTLWQIIAIPDAIFIFGSVFTQVVNIADTKLASYARKQGLVTSYGSVSLSWLIVRKLMFVLQLVEVTKVIDILLPLILFADREASVFFLCYGIY